MGCLYYLRKCFCFFTLIFIVPLVCCSWGCAPQKFGEISEVSFKTEDDTLIIGTFFKGYKNEAVIFAHGNVFSKESWYSLAKKFQREGIASLAFDFRGSKGLRPINTIHLDVLASLDFMKQKGFKKISIVAASIGATSVLRALAQGDDYPIDTVILMAPPKGKPLEDSGIKKIFIVSKNDPVKDKVGEIYENCAEPKFIKIFPGVLHAQFLFESDFKSEVEDYILESIKD